MNDIKDHSILHIAVLIPARDEEQLVGRCLQSVLKAQHRLPYGISSDVILVSDASTDTTAHIASSILRRTHGTVVQIEANCVGRARSIAAEVAMRRLRERNPDLPGNRCWLANTDADSAVPQTWLLDQLALAEEGWAAVAGIVDVDSFNEHDQNVATRFQESYVIHADGSHPHVHGANLGIRADSYLAAGGWGDLTTAEDHDLWNRLGRGKHPRISAANLRVMTSGRRVGRAPAGFAGALAAHNEVGF